MMKGFNKDEWHYHGRWVQATLPCSFWPYWDHTESKKEIIGNEKFERFVPFNCHFFNKEKDLDKYYDFIKGLFSNGNSEDFIRKFEEIAKKYEEKHLRILSKDLDLKSYIEELFNTYLEIIGVWMLALFLSEALEKHIIDHGIAFSQKDLMDKSGKMEVKKTWLEVQSIEVKELVRKIKEKGVLKEDINEDMLDKELGINEEIEEHVKKFEWFGTHHWEGEPYDVDKCLEQIKEGFDKDHGEKIIKEKPRDPVWRLLALFIYWRTHCAEVTAKVVYESRDKLEAAADKFGLSYEDFLYLSMNEILDALQNEEFSVPENLEGRKESFAYIVDEEGKEEIIVGEEVKELEDYFLGQEDMSNISELKGITASKGKTVTGVVKIIQSPKDFDKFEGGDILVAPETTPDFVPSMKKSAAILTERGGVTSHAAIVSRELGVPCILNLKNITRIVKDGDLIEVDSEEGVVKVLKRVSS